MGTKTKNNNNTTVVKPKKKKPIILSAKAEACPMCNGCIYTLQTSIGILHQCSNKNCGCTF